MKIATQCYGKLAWLWITKITEQPPQHWSANFTLWLSAVVATLTNTDNVRRDAVWALSYIRNLSATFAILWHHFSHLNGFAEVVRPCIFTRRLIYGHLTPPRNKHRNNWKSLLLQTSTPVFDNRNKERQTWITRNSAEWQRWTCVPVRAQQGHGESPKLKHMWDQIVTILLYESCWSGPAIFCASKHDNHKLNISLYELFLPKPTIFTIENKKTIKWIRLFRKHERLSWRTRFHFMIFLFPIVKIVCFGKNNS